MLSQCTFALYMNKPYFNKFSEKFTTEKSKAARAEMLLKLWKSAYDMGGP